MSDRARAAVPTLLSLIVVLTVLVAVVVWPPHAIALDVADGSAATEGAAAVEESTSVIEQTGANANVEATGETIDQASRDATSAAGEAAANVGSGAVEQAAEETTATVERTAEETAQTVETRAKAGAGTAADASQTAAGTVDVAAGAGSGTADQAADTVGQASGSTGTGVEAATKTIEATAEETSGTVGKTGSQQSGTPATAAGQVSTSANDTIDQTSGTVSGALDETSGVVGGTADHNSSAVNGTVDQTSGAVSVEVRPGGPMSSASTGDAVDQGPALSNAGPSSIIGLGGIAGTETGIHSSAELGFTASREGSCAAAGGCATTASSAPSPSFAESLLPDIRELAIGGLELLTSGLMTVVLAAVGVGEILAPSGVPIGSAPKRDLCAAAVGCTAVASSGPSPSFAESLLPEIRDLALTGLELLRTMWVAILITIVGLGALAAARRRTHVTGTPTEALVATEGSIRHT